MRLIFLVVGKMKSGPERELVDEYLKRARPVARGLGFRGIEEIEVASGGGLDAEAGRILDKIPSGARVLRLDEFGPALQQRHRALERAAVGHGHIEEEHLF